MSDSCGSVTADGNSVCMPSASGRGCSCASESRENKPIQLSIPTIKKEENTMWKKIRNGFVFVVACIASPCCTPILVPIGLALLAGTPIAVWATAYIGWVYGGLTLLSVVSLVLGLRWKNQKNNTKLEPKTKIHSIQEVNQS